MIAEHKNIDELLFMEDISNTVNGIVAFSYIGVLLSNLDAPLIV